MTIPSRVLGAGASSLMTVAICGDGVDGLTAVGSTRADALQLTKIYNSVDTAASGTGVLLASYTNGGDNITLPIPAQTRSRFIRTNGNND
jgi:hypothetical protein